MNKLVLVTAAFAAIACCLASPSAAQRKRSGKPRTASEAIARFERAGEDHDKRRRALRDLARFADTEVTHLLIDELHRAGDDVRYRTSLADAIGAVRRDGVLVPLEELLFSPAANAALRRASAKGIARQGEQGVALLDEIIRERLSLARIDKLKQKDERTRGHDLRTACVRGLGLGTTEVAWNALADVVQTGRPSERIDALRGLSEVAPSETVTAARVAAAASRELELAALGAQQLAAHGHARAFDVVMRVHRKIKANAKTKGEARAALIRAMLPLLDRKELFDPFVRQASFPDADVAKTVDSLREALGQREELQRWLLASGLRRSQELERCLVIRLLAHSPDPKATQALTKLVRSTEPAIVYTAVRALGERGDQAAVPELRKLLKAPGGERRIEALFGLHALQKAEPEWEAQLLDLVSTQDRPFRATVLDFLADLGSVAGLEKVYADLNDSDWTLRAAAYDYCRAVRSVDSIPHLIARVDAETGRLRHDLLDTLQSLTARRYPTTEKWTRWWSDSQSGFELIPERDGRKKPRSRDRDRGRTVTYYKLPLVSDRVAFVVDVSGSMKAGVGTSKKRSRLDEAKRQLEGVVTEMSKSTKFNIVFFNHKGRRLFKTATSKSKSSASEAITAVQRAKSGGGTNVFEALELVFADETIDTIYLLSDGYPSSGPIQDAEALADEVARWNRTRQVRIHGIAIGSDSGLLRRLARESGGQYTHTR